MIGDLRHEISLERRSLIDDGAGGLTETWSSYASVWGHVESNSDAEQFRSEQTQFKRGFRIRIRFRDDILPDDRIVYDDVVLNILSIADPKGLKRWTMLTCREDV